MTLQTALPSRCNLLKNSSFDKISVSLASYTIYLNCHTNAIEAKQEAGQKGQGLFNEAALAHLAEEDRLLSALTSEQREQLASLLRILLLSFEPIAGEDPRHPSHWISASLAPAHVARHIRRSAGLPDTAGLLGQGIAVPSRASQAGLREGDLIIAAGGAKTRSIESLYEQLVKAQGATLSIEVLRGVEKHTLVLALDHPPTT